MFHFLAADKVAFLNMYGNSTFVSQTSSVSSRQFVRCSCLSKRIKDCHYKYVSDHHWQWANRVPCHKSGFTQFLCLGQIQNL